MPLDPNLLRTFLAVARAGSVTAAARALHRSQPAISGQLRSLEDSVGAPLFHRGPRGVRPTALGERLRPHAEALERVVDAAAEQLHDHRALRAGTLMIFASTTVAHAWLPPRLGAFHRAHPNVRLEVQSGNSRQALQALAERRVDVALVEGPDLRHPQLAPGAYRAVAVHRDEIVAIVTPGHPLAQRPGLRAVDLDQVDLVEREEGSGTREVVRAWLRSGGAKPRIRAVIDAPGPLLSAVRAGLGVGFLSRDAVTELAGRGGVAALPLAPGGLHRPFTLLAPADPFASHAARAFVSAATRTAMPAATATYPEPETPRRTRRAPGKEDS